MFDAAGNLYYDTEDPRTGMYIVSTIRSCVHIDAAAAAASVPLLQQSQQLTPPPPRAEPSCQVDTAGDMFNQFVDKNGKVRRCSQDTLQGACWA